MPGPEPLVRVTQQRRLTLPLLTFYGLGTIVGADIYVLIGAVAQRAGLYAPAAFLTSALIAGLAAHSYAEL
jgi:APA family basic amino acid/polyamine antiporter